MVGYENIIKYELSTGERFVLSEDKGYSESELYKFNLSTAEGKKISSSFKGNDSYSLIKGLSFVDKKTIMISSYATTSTVNMVVKGYRFDLQKEKVIEEYFLPYAAAYSYNEENTSFYYINNYTIKRYDITSNDETIIGRIDENLLEGENLFIKRLYYLQQNVIVWDHVNNYFIIIDLESEFEPLKIILSDDVSIHFNLEPVIKQFEEEYNCPIHITEYTKDVYDDKLRTKILANDKDFDIFITSKPTENNLLASILNHKLYEPLNNYSNIVDNFSYMYTGIEEMMTYNGDLFAIPYYIQIYSTAAVNYDVSQYGYNFPGKHWSLNDLCKHTTFFIFACFILMEIYWVKNHVTFDSPVRCR